VKDHRPFLKHIVDECEYIESVLKAKSFEDFIKDETLKKAIVRSLEIIGEAAKNVPEHVKNKHGEIPWKKIIGLRDVLVHRYFGVDYANVWKIVKEDIPELKRKVCEMLER
jgi:uncharacterized protein with HEPN domain